VQKLFPLAVNRVNTVNQVTTRDRNLIAGKGTLIVFRGAAARWAIH